MTSKRKVAAISDALTGRGRLGHSPLYWWMWDNFDQLWKERQGRADWISATEEFSKLGFTNRDKTPLKRDNVRKTWERVVRDRKARKSARPVHPPTQPAVRPVTPPQPQTPTGAAPPAPVAAPQPGPASNTTNSADNRFGLSTGRGVPDPITR